MRYSWKKAEVRNTMRVAEVREAPEVTRGLYRCLTHHLEREEERWYQRLEETIFTCGQGGSKVSRILQYFPHSTSHGKNPFK